MATFTQDDYKFLFKSCIPEEAAAVPAAAGAAAAAVGGCEPTRSELYRIECQIEDVEAKAREIKSKYEDMLKEKEAAKIAKEVAFDMLRCSQLPTDYDKDSINVKLFKAKATPGAVAATAPDEAAAAAAPEAVAATAPDEAVAAAAPDEDDVEAAFVVSASVEEQLRVSLRARRRLHEAACQQRSQVNADMKAAAVKEEEKERELLAYLELTSSAIAAAPATSAPSAVGMMLKGLF